jgi:hypothetical protein
MLADYLNKLYDLSNLVEEDAIYEKIGPANTWPYVT